MTDTLPRPTAVRPPTSSAPTLTWRDNRFVRGGEPTQILSGSLHYFRVHPAQWRDRLMRMRDLGLNTVDTYVPWNFHQPRRDTAPAFDGWRDIAGFLGTAHDLGLDAVVRPGPYICAEWSNGGLPVWLTGTGAPLRTADERFLQPVRTWFDHLLPVLSPLQANLGGPIVAVQVENEFGSYGDDTAYTAAMADLLRDGGITELLFTADGPTDVMLEGGAVDGVVTGLTLGSRAHAARELARSRRPDEPFFAAEFWNGWFDHWGHPHHIRTASSATATLADIIDDGGNVSLYMAHGGTNFGLWAGANRVDGELRPTVTSYDSDAPIAEDGRLTEKFHAMREVFAHHAPITSSEPTFVAPRMVRTHAGLDLGAALDSLAGESRRVGATPTFESFNLESGLLRLQADAHLPDREFDLVLPLVADRAHVRLAGLPAGEVATSGSVRLRGAVVPVPLEIVVESLGRVNYGWSTGEFKGLMAPALVERRAIQRWEASPIDVAAASNDMVAGLAEPGRGLEPAGAATAVFELAEPADAHLAMIGFGRGFAWINGFLLGRYWHVGPQQTLYVPAPLLQAGRNVVTLLDLERRGTAIELRDRPELGPEEEYIEQF